jgi:NAD(P)-dependent dehydrogenase (short-subunit alcohol dehydrogenase family)
VSKPDHRGAVCVTGAAGGIGEVLVRRLLEENYAVSAWDMAPGPLAAVDDPRFVFHSLNVRDAAALGRAVADAQSRFGRLHGLVSLAAIYKVQPFLEIDDETWDRHFSINLKGTLLALQATLPPLRAQKSGSVVLFSSLMARTGLAGSAAYAATKGGILGLARATAIDVAADKVRVNTVSPTIADTAMPRANMSDEQIRARMEASPMKRIGLPIDMAEAAIFLLDPENSFMTGADIRVNGGATLF